MILNTKLLNLLGILAIGIFNLDVSVASEDLDDTLKQALFLVKLLKTDFTQILREKNDVTANSTEEENSTCSLPSEDFNSTTPMYETEVTASGVSSTNVVSLTPSMPYTPPPSMPDTLPASMPPGVPMMMPTVAPGVPMMMPNSQPGGPMMMPYANWPAMPMGYPQPPGPARRNYQDENNRFPYRFNHRRMMPDYYYFDPPVQSRGSFRRFGDDPTDNLNNTPATPQAQTTTSVSSATREETTLNVGETTASTTSLATTKSEQSTSILPTNSANHSILPTNSSNPSTLTNSANQFILPTNSSNQSIPINSANKSILPTNSSNPSILTNSANQFILPTNSNNLSIPINSANKSILPTNPSNQSILTNSVNQSVLTTNSSNQPIPNNSANQSILLTNSTSRSILVAYESSNKSILPTSVSAKQAVNSNQILAATGNSFLRSAKSTNHLPFLLVYKNPKLRTIKPPTLTTKPRQRVSANQSILLTNSTSRSILAASESSNKSILPTSVPAKQAVNSSQILAATGNSFLRSAKSTNHLPFLLIYKNPKLRTIKPPTLTTKPRQRVKHRKRVPVSKATTTLISSGNENHHKVRNHHLRQIITNTETSNTDDYSSELENYEDNVEKSHDASKLENNKVAVEIEQVVSELEKEFEDNDNTEDTSNEENSHKKPLKIKSFTKTSSTKRTTMKVFLKGSSRIPVPFPENNAFCYFHPKNALCGTY